MNLNITIRPDAEADIENAAFWYEKQRPGLGNDFLDEVQSTLKILTENPCLYPVVHKNIRRALIRRFPFGLYYFIDKKFIIVAAVMHSSRHPENWKKRRTQHNKNFRN